MHIFKEMKITDKLIVYMQYSLTTRDLTKTKYMHGDLQVIGGSCEWGGGYHWSYCHTHRWVDLVVD